MKPFNNPTQQMQQQIQQQQRYAYWKQQEAKKKLRKTISSNGLEVKYGPLGRPSQIGDLEVKYGPLGRPSQIGDLEVKYGLLGRPSQVGDLEIKYGAGGPSWIGASGVISNAINNAEELIQLLRFNKKELAVLLVLLMTVGG